jgi:hypothetical protein
MRAAALLARARAAGLAVELEGGQLAVSGQGAAPAELLARLRDAKAELVGILTGRLCRHCARPIDYTAGSAVAFADDQGAHVGCYEQAEIDRLLAAAASAVDPRHADDPAEISIRGELPLDT